MQRAKCRHNSTGMNSGECENLLKIDKFENKCSIETDNESAPLMVSMLRLSIFILHRLINILYIPIFIYRVFEKRKQISPISDDFLCISANELTWKILNREISCENVILRYIRRIRDVNPILNAIINDRFSSALGEAKDIDKLIKSNQFTTDQLHSKYPLLGVPITIKGSLAVKDLPFTSGMVKRQDIIATEDAVAVKKAREAGAVILLTSNIPELCLNWESTNKLVGTTNNPYDSTRTAGGSSGGEASLMGAGASLIGIGSDIAGSLRLPPHFCGTYGHKPTPGAVSYKGHYPGCKNEKEWRSFFSVGPMARYSTDLKTLLNIIVEDEFKETLRLNDSVGISDINVYYIDDTQNLLASNMNSDTKNIFKNVMLHLDKVCKNNKCTKLDFPLMKYSSELAYFHLLDIDDVDNFFKGQGEGSIIEFIKYIFCKSEVVLGTILYGLLKKVHSWLPKKFAADVDENIKLLRDQFLEVLKGNSVVIMPAGPAEAHKHCDVYRKVFDGGYMAIFNALGFPVTCGPVGYSKSGLPIGVQVIAAPNCDRLTLAVTEELEKAFGGWHPPTNM